MANPRHDDPLAMVYSKQSLQRQLYKELETATLEMDTARTQLNLVGELALQKVLNDLRAGTLDAFKASVCYHKLVDAHVKLENLRMNNWDRLHGVSAIEITEADKVVGDDEDKVQRGIQEISEALLKRVVMKKLEAEKAAAANSESKKDESAA